MSFLSLIYVGIVGGLSAGIVLRFAQLAGDFFRYQKHFNTRAWLLELIVILIFFLLYSIVVLIFS